MIDMPNCWLSPEGKFYWCHYPHATEAGYICEKVYGEIDYDDDNSERDNPERFLEKRNWMKYSRSCKSWFMDLLLSPTEAQIKAILDETGEDISGMG